MATDAMRGWPTFRRVVNRCWRPARWDGDGAVRYGWVTVRRGARVRFVVGGVPRWVPVRDMRTLKHPSDLRRGVGMIRFAGPFPGLIEEWRKPLPGGTAHPPFRGTALPPFGFNRQEENGHEVLG